MDKSVSEHDLHEHLHDLTISSNPAPLISSGEPSVNPWDDNTHYPDAESGPPHVSTHVPDLPALDPVIAQGFAADAKTEPKQNMHTSLDVLQEFDPLVDREEMAVREAWVASDSHPPRPQTPPKIVPQPQTIPKPYEPPLIPNRPSSPISGFPALAALARTFSLPLGGRQRRSLDTAVSVPSPNTLSSFATQQQMPQSHNSLDVRHNPITADSEEAAGGDRASESTSVVETVAAAERDPIAASGSGTNTPGGSKPPPFDFQKFLDQMKMKGAEPVAKYLRSFLSNFAKRTFTVNDQVKLINDFLNFISVKMRDSDVWRNATEAEFDNAMEGMEKLVMNRLYDFTFTPQVIRMIPPRPVTADDLERDRVLSQRISLFGWIEPMHLDIPIGSESDGFVMFAEQELLKINHYKAPRDKLICILNCCKVIFGLIRHLRKEEGADTFVPILIYVVLKANPDHLLSNVEFINRFRNPAKLQSEAGYYLSSLMGAVSFIETMDHTSLSNITQEEFENNVEEAIQSLPSTGTHTPEPNTPLQQSTPSPTAAPLPSSHTGEESAQLLALPTPAQTLSDDARRFLQKTGDTISKPLSAIGRIFSEVLDGAEESFPYLPGPFAPFEVGRENQQHEQARRALAATGLRGDGQRTPPIQPPYKPRVRRAPSSSPSPSPSRSGTFLPEDTRYRGPYANRPLSTGPAQSVPNRLHVLAQSDRPAMSAHVSRTPTPNLDIAGLQGEIERAHEQAAVAARDTLRQIFPGTDAEVVEWVLEANQGDLGRSIEALLEMSSGT